MTISVKGSECCEDYVHKLGRDAAALGAAPLLLLPAIDAELLAAVDFGGVIVASPVVTVRGGTVGALHVHHY